MRVIGLTGGIATGKSAVAEIIASHGIPVIDADLLAREAVLPGSDALSRISETFGPDVIEVSGHLDRAALAQIVFDDTLARKKLEAILHPAIKALAESRLAQLRTAGHSAAVYMAALLIEAGATDRVDEVWVVSAAQEVRIERIRKRDSLTRKEALLRIAAQMPMEKKVTYGRIVIENSGTLDELKHNVENLLIAEGLELG